MCHSKRNGPVRGDEARGTSDFTPGIGEAGHVIPRGLLGSRQARKRTRDEKVPVARSEPRKAMTGPGERVAGKFGTASRRSLVDDPASWIIDKSKRPTIRKAPYASGLFRTASVCFSSHMALSNRTASSPIPSRN